MELRSRLPLEVAEEKATEWDEERADQKEEARAEAELKVNAPRFPYHDPSLKDRRKYAQLLRLLHERGVVEYIFDDDCLETVGLFCVRKKAVNTGS